MKIGILVPSLYMHGDVFRKRISAPMELSLVLADGLVKKGREVLFFSGPDIPTQAEVVCANEELIESNLKIDYQQDMPQDAYETVSFYENKKYFELGVTEKAFKMALEKKVDILHVYHAYGNLSHYFTELLNVPTVYTLHVLPPPEGTLERWRYKRFANQNFVSISNSQKRGFLKIVPNMNIVDIIYHGIDLEKFSFSPDAHDYLAFIGRLIPEKGLDIAIKLALQQKFTLRAATHLNSVVRESDYYKEKILPFSQNEFIKINDLIGGEEKVNFYKNAKAILLPIQWEEPFGMVMIEAMACGTPVIAFARGAAPEIVQDGVTGFIVNPSDEDIRGDWVIKKTGIDGLKEAIERIYTMPKEEYRKMRLACRKRVEERFTVEKMVDNYEKLYKEIIEKNKS